MTSRIMRADEDFVSLVNNRKKKVKDKFGINLTSKDMTKIFGKVIKRLEVKDIKRKPKKKKEYVMEIRL